MTGASNVTDALALDRARQDGALAAGTDWGTGLPGPGADQDKLIGLFAALDDMVDAISDLGIAEAVYQTMRGNPDRAAGTLDGVSQAQRMPQPQVTDTPRGGTDQTHRAAVLLAGLPARPAGWASIPATPRALAEPWLDAWVARLLPDPAAIGATVTYTDGSGTVVSTDVRLSDLSVGPLDILAMCRITSTAQRSELDDRVLYQVLPPAATDVSISYAAAPPATHGRGPAQHRARHRRPDQRGPAADRSRFRAAGGHRGRRCRHRRPQQPGRGRPGRAGYRRGQSRRRGGREPVARMPPGPRSPPPRSTAYPRRSRRPGSAPGPTRA